MTDRKGMTVRSSRKLGELLVDQRVLPRDVLEDLLRVEADSGRPLAKLLVERGHVREEDVLRAVASRVDVPFVDLDDALLEPQATGMLPFERAAELLAMPVRRESDGTVLVAVADPFNGNLRLALEEDMKSPVTLAMATREGIHRAIEFVYGKAAVTAESKPEPSINDMLTYVMENGGSDLHLTSGVPPQIRVNGRLMPIPGYDPLMPAELRRMIYGILTERQREALEEHLELDGSHPLPGRGRFRMNVFFQRDSIGAVFRAIPTEIMSIEELGMPPVLAEFAELHRGLVLVTGPTGAGKSTTLAAIIDRINNRRAVHILTIEDPIEFLHRHKKAIVNQREVGNDTLGFQTALRHALRQDPDVLLVGEMRDLETISTALTAAETGHLVFATLHTQDAPQTVDRIIDVFPAHQQQQVRVQLAATLQAIVTQQLVPSRDGRGRVAAAEVLVATPAIRNLIREGKTQQIATAMQSGGKYGMQTMDQSLADLVKRQKITFEEAVDRCVNLEDLRRLTGRVA